MTSALLSIDPGATSGVAVVSMGKRPGLLHHEVWKNKNGGVRPSGVVLRLLEQYQIVRCVVEDQFLKDNPLTLKKLSRTAGAWEEACLAAGLEVDWVNAATWQARVLGRRMGRKREEIIKSYQMIARQDTGVELTPDESAAWCMGRFFVCEIEQKKLLSWAASGH